MLKRIYLDHAASTPVRKEVKEAMDSFWDVNFGNPGAIHQEGVIAKDTVDQSRDKIAGYLGAYPNEIVFNSGGTEANNLAVFGVVNRLSEEGRKFEDMHLITTVFEHPSALQCFKYFEKKGVKVSYLEIDSEGIVDLKQLEEILTPQTVLISIMYVNNEIGTIQPLIEVTKIIRSFKKGQEESSIFPVLHSDAAQALLFLPINLGKLKVDLMSFDAQKIYGPKGVGALYVRKGIEINPLIIGGSQEGGLRPGTENVPLIVGFAKALELAEQEKSSESERLTKLRDYFIKEVLEKIPGTILNGSSEKRLPNNVNISFPGKDNEFLVIQLDQRGIACSTKSACLKEKSSYVIDSLGHDEGLSKSSIRFTFGRSTNKKAIDYVIKSLVEICNPIIEI